MRERENYSHDFFSLVIEPSLENSGVVIVGENSGSENADNNFYGVLDVVLHVQYLLRRRAWLFNCRLFDTDNNKSHRTYVELGYKSIATSHFWFAEDPQNGPNWKIVQMVQNKRIWDVLEVEDMENQQLNVLEIIIRPRVDEHIEDDTLCRYDVNPGKIGCALCIKSFSNEFHEADMFLELDNAFNNIGGSSSMGDTLG
ncbi:hypothetical protein E6C27_scaffold60G004860 [Cucumis melo var. makuwa]|nr:hypothetical protein E6C27_scaffold60G004860 [Cucumis melo var. makuwa]